MIGRLTFGPAVTAIAGAAIAINGVKQRELAVQMQGWPSVAGVVCRSAVAESYGWHDNGQLIYTPDVQYDYVVNGREYRGKRLSVASLGASYRSHAEGVIAEYPIGRPLTVYYDPAAPQESIVERTSAPSWAAALVGLGLVMVAGGLAWPWLVPPTA